jgi:chromosome segregation ATPase
MSVSQDILSELQSDSQQHHEAIEEQARRFDILDNQVQAQMDNFAKKMSDIEEEHKAQQAHHKKFSIQIESLSKSIPKIMVNMETQQTQLFDYFHEQNNINKKYAEELQALRQSHSIQQHEISNFKKIINELHQRQPHTPASLDHRKKKSRPLHPESPLNPQNLINREEHNETHQLEQVYQTPEISMQDDINDHSQIDIQNDNFFLPWNDASSDTSSDKKMSGTHSKNNSFDTVHEALGSPSPGSDT